MPFDSSGGTSLSPLTNKSVMPFNNVTTIQDVLEGNKYILPDAGGDWGKGNEDSPSYKEEGDEYKREIRDLKLFQDLSQPHRERPEKWIVVTPNKIYDFNSFPVAQEYAKKLRALNQPVKSVSKIAQSVINTVYNSINSCFMIESLDNIRQVKETGSCFCVKPNTFITCAHVIKKYDKRKLKNEETSNITLNIIQNNKNIPAKIVDVNWNLDLALVSCGIACDPISLDPSRTIGEEIIAIGSPHGFNNNVTNGIIGSDNRKIYNYDGAPQYFFVDAAILPGNSGGPIISVTRDKVVGMVTLIVSSGSGYGLNACLQSEYIIDYLSKSI